MGNNVKKRHHTIPSSSYLKHFADAKGHVWVLDTKNKIFPTSPDNVLVENHFYRITLKNGEKSVVIEDTLSNIEGMWAHIYETKISKNKFLDQEERAKVSIFIAAMLHRTKPHRESLRKMFEGLKEDMEDWKKQYLTMSDEHRRSLAATHSSGGATINLDELNEGLENFDEEHSSGLIEQIISTSQIIFEMKWSVCGVTEEVGSFVTSDSPVVVMRPESIKKYGKKAFGSRPGLRFKDAELTLPISSTQLLLAGWILEEDSYVSVPKEIIDAMNQRTILHSSERIIASSESCLEDIRAKYPPISK